MGGEAKSCRGGSYLILRFIKSYQLFLLWCGLPIPGEGIHPLLQNLRSACDQRSGFHEFQPLPGLLQNAWNSVGRSSLTLDLNGLWTQLGTWYKYFINRPIYTGHQNSILISGNLSIPSSFLFCTIGYMFLKRPKAQSSSCLDLHLQGQLPLRSWMCIEVLSSCWKARTNCTEKGLETGDFVVQVGTLQNMEIKIDGTIFFLRTIAYLCCATKKRASIGSMHLIQTKGWVVLCNIRVLVTHMLKSSLGIGNQQYCLKTAWPHMAWNLQGLFFTEVADTAFLQEKPQLWCDRGEANRVLDSSIKTEYCALRHLPREEWDWVGCK